VQRQIDKVVERLSNFPANRCLFSPSRLSGAASNVVRVTDWCGDNKFLLFERSGAVSLWVLPLEGERKPFAFTVDDVDERGGQVCAGG